MNELPEAGVRALLLQVRVVLRGTPTVEPGPGKVQIEYLPAADEGEFDVRPGATALYLEALGMGRDRFYLEVRSSPGQIVLATSSLESVETWLSRVRGILLDANGDVRLVNQWIDEVKGEVKTALGPSATELLTAFLTGLRIELQSRSRFNRAVDLA
ncbi:MAG TPA: hypothetical protein VMD91_12285 [Candidatus Sulfotelmatobacter sp.]|nr:hypothetical protein [Candidatus Sulfotelmatobacter sp.]